MNEVMQGARLGGTPQPRDIGAQAAPTQRCEAMLGELLNMINAANTNLDAVLQRLTGSTYPEKESVGGKTVPVPAAFLPLMTQGLEASLERARAIHDRVERLAH